LVIELGRGELVRPRDRDDPVDPAHPLEPELRDALGIADRADRGGELAGHDDDVDARRLEAGGDGLDLRGRRVGCHHDHHGAGTVSPTVPRMGTLDGVRALVSGSTSGLGLAMAAALADAGASVAVSGRSGERAAGVARRLGDGAFGVELDVRDEGSVVSAVDEVWRRLGGLDLLVNNAGIGMRTVNPRFLEEPQPFWAVAPDGFRDVVETKLSGCFLLARAVVPRMLDAGGGRVVTISMNESTMTRRGFVPYGPAGAGVEALARVMAADLADSPVRANMLLPGGATATGMIPDERVSAELGSGLLDPGIMGPPIVWLASPEAAEVHDERIAAVEFEAWLAERRAAR